MIRVHKVLGSINRTYTHTHTRTHRVGLAYDSAFTGACHHRDCQPEFDPWDLQNDRLQPREPFSPQRATQSPPPRCGSRHSSLPAPCSGTPGWETRETLQREGARQDRMGLGPPGPTASSHGLVPVAQLAPRPQRLGHSQTQTLGPLPQQRSRVQ